MPRLSPDPTWGKYIEDNFGMVVGHLRNMAVDDGRDPAWKAQRRDELVKIAGDFAAEATARAQDVVRRKVADAERRLREEPIGTAAEESRRVADELRVQRLVDAARNDQSGAKRAAEDLILRSQQAFDSGLPEEARVLAMAAEQLGHTQAAAYVGQAQTAIDVKIPARKAAIDERATWEVFAATARRDVEARVLEVERRAAEVSEVIGDAAGRSRALQRAAEASVNAKAAAAVESMQTGEPYSDPPGTGV